ncbi:heme-binding protein [Agrobacterium vitis]
MEATVETTAGRIGGGQQGQFVDPLQPVVPPTLSLPLINEPAQANPPAETMSVGALEYLIGTWTNQNIGASGRGGPENPFSYNLMTLPQSPTADPSDPTQSPFGYILKSMSYYEEITFSAIHGTAANRGGTGSQISHALLYEQRVYISDGPAKDMLVHFENGIWGFLTPAAQELGPYGDGDGDGDGEAAGLQTFGTVPPELHYNIFKQISVPHGNSVLACGTVDASPVRQGSPVIGPPPQVLPAGNIDTGVYTRQSVQNLNPVYAQNPNQPLMDALVVSLPIKQFVQLDVNSDQGGGAVANINYEQERADVTQYYATYWIEDTGNGQFDQLQYSQTIMLKIPIVLKPGDAPTEITFPHITTNTLTKVPGSGVLVGKN